ncbi:hypothetical protein AKJ09_09438 [Labilithrix luteola]|uniref:Uncharacterized protein n=1 Tax=Labilithrix luteola TaxID=1391654 RepID=A0A0K1QBJ2_9BACT|nr:hypothetical protein AKJ09_09438 [Labilithrix luteola]
MLSNRFEDALADMEQAFARGHRARMRCTDHGDLIGVLCMQLA